MGLLTKEVEVILNGKNIKYFEDLGYVIPRIKNKYGKIVTPRGSKICVKVDDLLKYSKTKIRVECDVCHVIHSTSYSNYFNHNYDGKTYCNCCAKKLFTSRENHPNWNSDLTDEERKICRNYPEYKDFIKRVLLRDNYTCQCCGQHADSVHHLYGYSFYSQYRTDDKFSIALCNECHNGFHAWHYKNYGWNEKGKNTKEQFEEWTGMKNILLEKYNGEIPIARKVYCLEEDKIYYSAEAFASAKDIDRISTRRILNRQRKSKKISVHILWYDEYLKMSKKEIQDYIKWCDTPTINLGYTGHISPNRKKTICLTTMEIFNSITQAGKKYNLQDIKGCCKGRYKYYGKLSDGTKLQWKYLEDYLEENKDKIENIDEFIKAHIVDEVCA